MPTMPEIKLNEQEEQWLTGFTEGDGCISLYSPKYVNVQYSQKEREILDYISSLLNSGNVHKYKIYQLTYYKNCPLLLTTFSKHVVSKHSLERLNIALNALQLPYATLHKPTLNWLTGFFDAEGTSNNIPSLTIEQKEHDVLETIKVTFGGSVHQIQNHHRPYYRWYLSGNMAHELVHELVTRSHNPIKAEHTLNNFSETAHKENLTYANNYYESHKKERSVYAHTYHEKQKQIKAYFKEHPETLNK